MPDFNETVERLLSGANQLFAAYVRIIFTIAALGIGWIVFKDVFLEPNSLPVVHSERVSGKEDLLPARQSEQPRQ